MCSFFVCFIFVFIMYNQNPALVSHIFHKCLQQNLMSQLVLNKSEILRKVDLRETCTTFFKHYSQPFNLLKGDAAVVLDLAATILLFT